MGKIGSFIWSATKLPFQLIGLSVKGLNTALAWGTEKLVTKDAEKARKVAPFITGGVLSGVTAGTFAIMAHNANVERTRYEEQRALGNQFPILSVAIGKSSSTESRAVYYSGTSINKELADREALYECDKDEGARCHIVAITNSHVPDCFKMTVTAKPYGDYPHLTLTPLYNDAGVRNETPLDLTCTRATISNEWSTSCSMTETLMCNNEGLLEPIIAEMNAAPRVTPN